MIDPLAAAGFSRAAEEYERARPSYAPEAVAWIADRCGLGPGTTIVDVGAGTGKWSRVLAVTGARIVAVEPLAEMRDQLRLVAPGIEAVDGRAEALPVPEGSARLVSAAQAFHWFGPEAPAEFARALEPGGAVALVWNVRDADDPLQRRIQEIHERERPGEHGRDDDWGRLFSACGGFGEFEQRSFPHVQRLGRDDLVTRTASVSFVAAAEPAERERILDEVRAIARELPERIELSYVTDVYVADRL